MGRTLWKRWISNLERIGADGIDSEDIRLQKRLLVAIALMISSAGLIWGSIFLAFEERVAATIPLTYTAVSAAGFVVLAFTRDLRLFRTSQLLAIMLLPFLLMLSLGGFVKGSAGLSCGRRCAPWERCCRAVECRRAAGSPLSLACWLSPWPWSPSHAPTTVCRPPSS